MKKIGNEEAVSPVIGVILMVVITVIIAAILAVFAFGIGGPTKTPQANLKYEATSDNTGNYSILISHNGGDALKFADLVMTVDKIDMGLAGETMGAYCDDGAGGALTGISVTQSAICKPNSAVTFSSPGVIHITILHTPSGQVISDVDVGVRLIS